MSLFFDLSSSITPSSLLTIQILCRDKCCGIVPTLTAVSNAASRVKYGVQVQLLSADLSSTGCEQLAYACAIFPDLSWQPLRDTSDAISYTVLLDSAQSPWILWLDPGTIISYDYLATWYHALQRNPRAMAFSIANGASKQPNWIILKTHCLKLCELYPSAFSNDSRSEWLSNAYATISSQIVTI